VSHLEQEHYAGELDQEHGIAAPSQADVQDFRHASFTQLG
jgi:hypothetical protein